MWRQQLQKVEEYAIRQKEDGESVQDEKQFYQKRAEDVEKFISNQAKHENDLLSDCRQVIKELYKKKLVSLEAPPKTPQETVNIVKDAMAALNSEDAMAAFGPGGSGPGGRSRYLAHGPG